MIHDALKEKHAAFIKEAFIGTVVGTAGKLAWKGLKSPLKTAGNVFIAGDAVSRSRSLSDAYSQGLRAGTEAGFGHGITM